MFKKPLRIKSNTQTKASERKNFKDVLLKTFPNITEHDLNDLLPKKDALNILKVVTHDEKVLHVYTVQKQPMIFDVDGRIFPTIFLLWRFPNLKYCFTTHREVMNFITSGADLMLPGVVTPPQQSGLPKYGNVSENDIVYVNLSSNRAAVAVGVASQSSLDMIRANGRGKCVNIYHFYGDYLCTLEGVSKCPLPNLGVPEWLSLKNYEDDFPILGSTKKVEQCEESNTTDDNPISKSAEEQDQPNPEEVIDENLKPSTEETVESYDDVLMYCFLGALKYSKNLVLPVLTSNFFKNQMLPLCPPDKTLDIKKTSYKKLKPFLEKMSKEGIISVRETKPGVESLIEINKNHPQYTSFYIDRNDRPKAEGDTETAQRTDVVESYVITANVLPIFQSEGYKKGDVIQVPDVRKFVTKYVKDNNLQHDDNPKLLKPKDTLAVICKTESPVTWEEAIEQVCHAMKNCFKVKTGNTEIVTSGKVSPITMTVSVRSGNKKVTLVDNLESFGININEFAKKCQHGVAASTSINKLPGKKYDQLLVQGNQVLFIYNLLIEQYKVPKKYIKGLENAPKKKK